MKEKSGIAVKPSDSRWWSDTARNRRLGRAKWILSYIK